MSGTVREIWWHALRTLPQREFMGAKLLRYDGLIAEVKTERRLRRKTKWDKERKYITFNAAPGYIFVGTPAGNDPRNYVRPLHIFRSFVSKDGVPLRLPALTAHTITREGEVKSNPGVMDFLNLQEGELPGYYRYHKTGREFSIGDTVIINTGPFRDHQVRVDDIQNGEAIFFLRMLGRDQEVRINVNDCIKAEAA